MRETDAEAPTAQRMIAVRLREFGQYELSHQQPESGSAAKVSD